MSDTRAEEHRQITDAIARRLESLGWEIEYYCDGFRAGYMEVFRPDPDTGHAMQFSGWWLSWRLVDGKLAYGVGDDTADLVWRQPLNVPDPFDAAAVADAADRAMHMLWHLEERELCRKLYAQNGQLRRIKRRVEELALRVFVTPGMLRDALKTEPREP